MTQPLTRNEYLIRVLERFETPRRERGRGLIPMVRFSLVVNGLPFGGFILPESQFDGLIADLGLRPEPGASERYASESLLAPERETER